MCSEFVLAKAAKKEAGATLAGTKEWEEAKKKGKRSVEVGEAREGG